MKELHESADQEPRHPAHASACPSQCNARQWAGRPTGEPETSGLRESKSSSRVLRIHRVRRDHVKVFADFDRVLILSTVWPTFKTNENEVGPVLVFTHHAHHVPLTNEAMRTKYIDPTNSPRPWSRRDEAAWTDRNWGFRPSTTPVASIRKPPAKRHQLSSKYP